MRRFRSERATPLSLLLVVAFTVAATATGCGSSRSSGAAAPTPTSRAAPPSASLSASASRDAIADCASQIDYWITTEYLRGIPDRGDYQEMGLGSAEGLALRQLEQHLGQTIKSFPAPAPATLRPQELAACEAAGSSATATGSKPPVWP
jgi:hypothetical protein